MIRCTYCGIVPAEDKDHVIPRSYADLSGQTFEKKNVVPCCKECNRLLGAKPYFTIGARAKYLEKEYKKKYRRVLCIPHWDEDDFEDMAERLVLNIKASLFLKKEIQLRIDHCEYIALLAPSIEDIHSEVDDQDRLLRPR